MSKYIRKEVIGDCTLYLGNCVDIVNDIDTVGALVSDPPFGMDFKSNHRKESHKKIANDDNEDLLVWACSKHLTI